MSKNNETLAKIKKVQLFLLIPISICFIVMIALGAAQQMNFYPIPCVILIILGIIEIALVVKRKSLSKQPKETRKQPKTSNPSFTYR